MNPTTISQKMNTCDKHMKQKSGDLFPTMLGWTSSMNMAGSIWIRMLKCSGALTNYWSRTALWALKTRAMESILLTVDMALVLCPIMQ